ncbi:hypothetical protein GCM10010172_77820 [Paractinoplanes ferrugineus]|uniref:Uncharacterized protein n=1 Tax=Paractinoplanes ferrugineus TaxID=113564 RepID=A0A919MHP6_9ACTN|nr:hypothetical protein [Actinoplanes ferrugineus]GIE12855.1 hypothetical protein Afe05nite_46950 [Actinoplanes ferrugineus]
MGRSHAGEASAHGQPGSIEDLLHAEGPHRPCSSSRPDRPRPTILVDETTAVHPVHIDTLEPETYLSGV